LGENGALYADAEQIPAESRAHRSLVETKDLHEEFLLGVDNAVVLIGVTADGETWLQLEGNASAALDILNPLEAGANWTGTRNTCGIMSCTVRPTKTSAHSDYRHRQTAIRFRQVCSCLISGTNEVGALFNWTSGYSVRSSVS